VDNGWLMFNHFYVPYSALLDRFGQIDDEGNYVSKTESISKRFAMHIACLTGGRCNIPKGSLDLTWVALITAIRYGLAWKQFGNPEKPIMDYTSHQYRLFTWYSETWAHYLAAIKIRDIWLDNLPNLLDEKNRRTELCHGLSSAAKAFSSEKAIEIVSECRWACGGNGFSAFAPFVEQNS